MGEGHGEGAGPELVPESPDGYQQSQRGSLLAPKHLNGWDQPPGVEKGLGPRVVGLGVIAQQSHFGTTVLHP